jgi:flavin-dependent dehydrogenase
MNATPTTLTAIPATLSAAAAAAVPWQAIVIGAGPAGGAVAWSLATRGVKVLLIDRHILPRGKVCGCCLSPQALRELRLLGDDAIPDGIVSLAAVRIAHRSTCVRLPLSAGGVVSRELLDTHLVRQAIAAGCQWLPSARVVSIDDSRVSPTATVTVAHAESSRPVGLHTAVAIIATGLADPVRIGSERMPGRAVGRRIAPRSRIGLGAVLAPTAADLPSGELLMVIGREGYCGLVRLDDGRIDVAAAMDRAPLASHADPAAAVAALLSESAGHVGRMLPTPAALHAAGFRATPALTRRAPLLAGSQGRIFRVGDAAGYVEPFTGEGIGWGLTSARLLVESLCPSSALLSEPSVNAASRYRLAHRRHFATRYTRCRLVAESLRHPSMVAAAVSVARAAPWAARRLVPALIGGGVSR